MKIMWSSNAPWSSSGYGQQTKQTLPLIAAEGHDIALSCFFGLEGGAQMWEGMPCYPTDQSRFGSMYLPDYVNHFGEGDSRSVLVMTLQDVWCLLPGVEGMKDLRFACWVPIDHDPAPPAVLRFLREVSATPIAMSRFGEARLRDEGFDPLYVPHAVDTNVFRPQPDLREVHRDVLKIPRDAFVVGMVANNQGLPSRKSYPQVFEAFARFHRKHSDSILYVHGDVYGRNNGVNLIQLAKACGIPPDAMRASDQLKMHIGLPPEAVSVVYNAIDVLAMPSMGEGFGIPLVEAQACGVPVITTDWTAMPELCGAGWLVQGERWYDATQNSFQKLPYIGEIADALEESYSRAAGLSGRAREFAVGYDIATVFETFWKPVLERLEKPREVAPLELVAA